MKASIIASTCSAITGAATRCMFVSRILRSVSAGMDTQRSTPAQYTWIHRIAAPAASTSGVQKPSTASTPPASFAASAASFAGTSSTPGATACSDGNSAGLRFENSTLFGRCQPASSRTGVVDSCNPSCTIMAATPGSGSTAD